MNKKLATLAFSALVAGTAMVGVQANTAFAAGENLVQNGNFETGDTKGWKIEGKASAVDIGTNPGDVRDANALHYWSDKNFKFVVSQEITGLADGTYTVSCWTQGSGGEQEFTLFVDVAGTKTNVPIVDTGWNDWHQWTITGVEVKGGVATVGIDMKANAGNWGSIDDITFVKE